MHFLTTILPFLPLLLAAPTKPSSASPSTYKPSSTAKATSSPTAPSGPQLPLPSSSLPPPSSLANPAPLLKHLGLGLGIQNYTCASPSSNPISIGAVATLFDALPLLSAAPFLIPTLPSLTLDAAKSILRHTSSGSDFGPALTSAVSRFNIPVLGKHFFSAPGVPNFDLFAAHPPAKLVAKKLGNAAAPPRDGDDDWEDCEEGEAPGDVDWLVLGDNGSGQTFGDAKFVYRVWTAGGVATCQDVPAAGGHVEVPYAAEYWFYG
ncbi:hypothetical protein EJ06DRAFT_582826 [Trichodelitschia bisporula]|uniref:Malate dehydrogenase n=1 Tax=Trichodelitschia bisporula TaxID=703511 RepID=A0A6G1HUL8_9PEZI|nr:hypothetical protein EJ06DRAFT_582826 [Trichodelitschia bisporula]